MENNSVAFSQQQKSKFDPAYIQKGIIMDTRDPTRSGRIRVWIEASQSQRSDKSSWITCKYSSIFAGSTRGMPSPSSYSDYGSAYGFWAVPPDVGCTVSVFFVNGNINDAYWFGCLYEDKMNASVPSPTVSIEPTAESDMPLPKGNYNRNDTGVDPQDKVINVPLIAGLQKQNLLYDPTLGLGNRSSSRSPTSRVLGLTSPRGNTFIIDDGFTDSELTSESWDQDPDGFQDSTVNNPASDTRVGGRKGEGIILRTRSGAQILLSEEGGNVFVINRDGTARVELKENGDIDVMSDTSINIRAKDDINIVAGKDINFEIGNNLNFKTGSNVTFETLGNFQSSTQGNTIFNTIGESRWNSKGDLRLGTTANMDILAKGNLSITSNGNLDALASGVMKINSSGALNLLAGSNANMTAGGSANVSGSTASLSGGSDTFSMGDGSLSSNAVLKAKDFISPSASLNSHIHNITGFKKADEHGGTVDPAYTGGASSNPKPPEKATSATPAKPADDHKIEEIPTTESEEVINVVAPPSVQEQLERDIDTSPPPDVPSQGSSTGIGSGTTPTGASPTSIGTEPNKDSKPSEPATQQAKPSNTLEAYKMVMPTTGVIPENGYWGRNIDVGNGLKTDHSSWTIVTSGDVVAVEEGNANVVKTGNTYSVVIAHKNGYKSLYYGLESISIPLKEYVTKGQTIGKARDILIFEIRQITASNSGFKGSVDPGMFYYTKTGLGKSAENKQLQAGETSLVKPETPTKPSQMKDTVKPTNNGHPYVNTVKTNRIGSGYASRGSKNAPVIPDKSFQQDFPKEYAGTKVVPPQINNVDKTEVGGWQVTPSDERLKNEIMYFEGSIEGQQRVGTFRNGKFFMFNDLKGTHTIGYGHQLKGKEYSEFRNGITPEKAMQVFESDLGSHIPYARKLYEDYNLNTPYMAQLVIVQMVFGLGYKGAAQFKRFFYYLQQKQYKKAGQELRNSTWFTQSAVRVDYYARVIEQCE